MLDPLLSERDLLAIAKARESELADLVRRGQVLPPQLRIPAWSTVAVVMGTSKSPRTKLMAARMVVDRTDPVPREGPETGAPKVTHVTVILDQSSHNGHALLPAGLRVALDQP